MELQSYPSPSDICNLKAPPQQPDPLALTSKGLPPLGTVSTPAFEMAPTPRSIKKPVATSRSAKTLPGKTVSVATASSHGPEGALSATKVNGDNAQKSTFGPSRTVRLGRPHASLVDQQQSAGSSKDPERKWTAGSFSLQMNLETNEILPFYDELKARLAARNKKMNIRKVADPRSKVPKAKKANKVTKTA